MFAALGRFSFRFRWIVVGSWLLLFAGGMVATPHLAKALQGGGFSNPAAPSQQAASLIQERLKLGETNLVVVFSSEVLAARGTDFEAAEDKTLATLRAAQIPHLESIQTYASTGSEELVSKDGKSSVAVLSFSAPTQTVQLETDQIRTALGGANALKAYVTGEPAVDYDLSIISMRDLRRIELYALPVALLALILVFGTLVSAALPVITGGLAVSVTLGGIYLLARVTSMSIFSMNTATLLGLAVAIDYALFMVARFREELGSGSSTEEAVVTTVARAGRSVFFSGVAVAVGVVGMVFIPFPAVRSLGIGGALVVFFSVAASLTFMPALLGLLGPRVNAIRIVPEHAAAEGRFWRGWSRLLTRRPWAVVLVTIALVAVAGSPILHMKTAMASATALPPSSESRQGYEILDSQFDRSALSPISVLVTWDAAGGSVDMAKAASLYTIGQRLAATPGVASVVSPFNLPGLTDVSALAGLWTQFQAFFNDPSASPNIPAGGLKLPDGTTISPEQLGQIEALVKGSMGPQAVLYRVVPKALPSSTEAQALSDTISRMKLPGGFEVHVAGETANDRDFLGGLLGRLPWVVAWIALTTFIILLFLLRSLLLPLVAVLVNALTIVMGFGAVVWLFQGSHYQSALGFTATGAIDAIIPVVMLCVLFGITMDYAVFSLTRMHESWLGDHDRSRSVADGLVHSGRIILSAAFLVIVVTAAFVFTRVSETKTLGMGIALAVALDAVLIRMALLPAIMRFLGKANWWMPRWLDAILPDTGHGTVRVRTLRPESRSGRSSARVRGGRQVGRPRP